jgi:uncharacterized Zn finger protein
MWPRNWSAQRIGLNCAKRCWRRSWRAPHAFERIEILLDEDMIDEAVACVDPHEARFSPYDNTLERLAEQAYANHSDWAIALALRMADPIMSEGRSGHYEAAAGWLCHRRKHKLRPLLEALR